MKTNGDEKETHLAETTATYALGVFCQLVNPYISGVDHHKKGFMKDFFDAVLEDDGLRNPLPQHHRNRKPGKTTITTGVWSGINDTDLTRFYNGRKKIPAWKAAEFYQRLDISKVERLCCDISIDALADFQKELIKANIRVTDISELPSATGKWLLSILQANAGGRDILIDGISFGSVKPTLTYERGALIREEIQTFSLWPLLLNGYRYSKARGVHVQHQCSGCGS